MLFPVDVSALLPDFNLNQKLRLMHVYSKEPRIYFSSIPDNSCCYGSAQLWGSDGECLVSPPGFHLKSKGNSLL